MLEQAACLHPGAASVVELLCLRSVHKTHTHPHPHTQISVFQRVACSHLGVVSVMDALNCFALRSAHNTHTVLYVLASSLLTP